MQLNLFAQPKVEGVEEKEVVPPALERLGQIEVLTLIISGDAGKTRALD